MNPGPSRLTSKPAEPLSVSQSEAGQGRLTLLWCCVEEAHACLYIGGGVRPLSHGPMKDQVGIFPIAVKTLIPKQAMVAHPFNPST